MKRKRRDKAEACGGKGAKRRSTLRSVIATQFDTEILIKHRELSRIEAEIERVQSMMVYMERHMDKKPSVKNLARYIKEKRHDDVDVDKLVQECTSVSDDSSSPGLFAALSKYLNLKWLWS